MVQEDVKPHMQDQVLPHRTGMSEPFKEKVANWANRGLLVPFFLLMATFLSFLDHHTYCVTCPETLIGYAIVTLFALGCSLMMSVRKGRLSPIVLAGLYVLVFDLQFTLKTDYFIFFLCFGLLGLLWKFLEEFYLVATWVCGTIFVVTILKMGFLLNLKGEEAFRFGPKWEAASHSQSLRPPLIHLILDEHIGIEKIPLEVSGGKAYKEKLIQFYVKNGFQLYGNAYSHDEKTVPSISHMMNFTDTPSEDLYAVSYGDHGETFSLLRNRYFEELAQRHYAINVLQMYYLDYCSNSSIPIVNCIEYPSYSINEFSRLPLPLSLKVQILFNYFLIGNQIKGIPRIVKRIETLATFFAQSRLAPNPIQSMKSLNALTDDIANFPFGNALVGHLLVPHTPFQFKSDCKIFMTVPTIKPTREHQSQMLFEQLDCLYLRLTGLFDRMREAGIFEQSIIILHGDHDLHQPYRDWIEKPNLGDLKDKHPTLFAVKMPGSQGKYDTTRRPITELLAEVLKSIPKDKDTF